MPRVKTGVLISPEKEKEPTFRLKRDPRDLAA